jgi:ATP-dependent Zn protease
LLENDPEKVNEPFEEIWNETVDILQSHWAAVEALAQALLKRKTLTRDELLAIWEATEGK